MIHLVFNDHLVAPDPEETERLNYAIYAHKKLQGGWGRGVLQTPKLQHAAVGSRQGGHMGPDENISSCRHGTSYVKSPTKAQKHNQSYFMSIFIEVTHTLWTFSQ